MDDEIRETINRVVRTHVKFAYGNDSCIRCIKVLAEVLKIEWNIKLTSHVVHLKVMPPHVLEVLADHNLSNAQQYNKIASLPEGDRIVGMVSSDSKKKIHMIGSTIHSNQGYLWDPSIDQVNTHFKSCKLKPICVSFSSVTQICEGDVKWDCIDIDDCRVMYSKESRFDSSVLRSDEWNEDYSSLINAVLSEIKGACN